jgi:uncharacterized membrane protein (DUF106 family)
MSDTDEPMTDDPTDDGRTGLLDDPDEARRYLMWAAVALLSLLAVVATFRVYTSASTAIARFVAPDFQPLFQAAFNLAVLLLAVAGITGLLRRLQAAT